MLSPLGRIDEDGVGRLPPLLLELLPPLLLPPLLLPDGELLLVALSQADKASAPSSSATGIRLNPCMMFSVGFLRRWRAVPVFTVLFNRRSAHGTLRQQAKGTLPEACCDSMYSS